MPVVPQDGALVLLRAQGRGQMDGGAENMKQVFRPGWEIEGKRRQYKRRVAFIRAAKNVPCTDCGVKYPYYVMEFDHARGEKVTEVSKLIARSFGWPKMKAEIAKCDVVCRNCHAERSYQRAQQNGWPGGERFKQRRTKQMDLPS